MRTTNQILSVLKIAILIGLLTVATKTFCKNLEENDSTAHYTRPYNRKLLLL